MIFAISVNFFSCLHNHQPHPCSPAVRKYLVWLYPFPPLFRFPSVQIFVKFTSLLESILSLWLRPRVRRATTAPSRHWKMYDRAKGRCVVSRFVGSLWPPSRSVYIDFETSIIIEEILPPYLIYRPGEHKLQLHSLAKPTLCITQS